MDKLKKVIQFECESDMPDYLFCIHCSKVCLLPTLDSSLDKLSCFLHLDYFNTNKLFSMYFRQIIQQVYCKCKICGKNKLYENLQRHQLKCEIFNKEDLIIQNYKIIKPSSYYCVFCNNLPLSPIYDRELDLFCCYLCQYKYKGDKRIENFQVVTDYKKDSTDYVLQCQNEFCQQNVSLFDCINHYKECQYQIKTCRLICQWKGFRKFKYLHDCTKKRQQTSFNYFDNLFKEHKIINELKFISFLKRKNMKLRVKLNQRIKNKGILDEQSK